MSRPHRTVTEPTMPWWRVGMVWLVIGGPLAVVVAGIVTAVIAIRGADPVLD
ncbi:MAG: nitrogen fixation protein FixH, partial [Rubrivivax sp.]|nr:nitrogen fixation protein FixH [Rubrivivax sp.]